MEQRASAVRNSDSEIEFDDVFGGPPMWTRYSYGGSRMRSWDEMTERPVFGEACRSPRRRTSDYTFRRGDQSVQWSSPTPTSLPAKMTKAAETPVFVSNVHTQNNHLSRLSTPATQTLRHNSGQFAGQTLLTRESSSKDSLYSTRSTEKDVHLKSKAKTGSSSIEFHFSMHKWANVGVPSLMSLHEGKSPSSSKVNGLSIDNMHDSVFPNDEKQDTLAMKQQVNEHSHGLTTLSSLLRDEFERKGYEEAGTKNMETVSGKKKLKAKKMSSSNKAEANKPKNRVKVMIKDLFKMSNQESPKTGVSSIWKTGGKKRIQEQVTDSSISNLDTYVEMMTDALKTTNLSCDWPAESVKIAPVTIPLDSRVPADNVNMMLDAAASFMGTEEIKRSKKQKFAQNRSIRKLEEDINIQKDASPASECIRNNGSQASAETIEDDLSFDNFQIEELAPVASEATMALDSKIHMWSSGRTGNIRSLLSTLHFVLWAESGWKAVALVDIIEPNALKKSYNRAMLCLHPDKLQQKGIDSHKKYIAQKVLDILQEAWDHLN